MIDFRLDHKSGVPIYRQIIDQIKFGIASGNWEPGEQLPTVRSLAVDLKVNLNTVSKAYKELEIQKILETQQGTGTFISHVKITVDKKEKQKKINSICTELLNVANSYGIGKEDLIRELQAIK
ncbi:MAG: GntR family transcriptional regulator [Deltaproteobacteria bacterium]|nr:GntR family transcriptional regulator [Deltaproteobacteria bacterium]